MRPAACSWRAFHTAVPEPQVVVVLDGPPPLVAVEQRLADERAQSHGGRATEPAAFPTLEVPTRERALPLEALDWPAAERDADHLLAGFHASGAALIDSSRAAETPRVPPLVALLKTQLDPEGLLPSYGDSPHA